MTYFLETYLVLASAAILGGITLVILEIQQN